MAQQGKEPDATTGLLQHTGSVADEDEDASVTDGRAVWVVSTNGHAHGVSAVPAPGSQLNASGTEISLDGPAQRAIQASGSGNTVSGGGSGKGGSSTALLKTTWKLKYQDFLPDKKGAGAAKFDPNTSEHFQKLVDRANEWLDKNRDVQVKTCQSMVWMSHDTKRLGSGEQMIMSKNFSDHSVTYYVRGLRLWVVPRAHGRRLQVISITDFIPDGPTDSIKNLIVKVNRKIESKQLKGHVVTVETICTPIVNGKVDCRITRWSENVVDDCPYAFSIRVFHTRYLDGQHSKHSNIVDASKLDVRDFVPQATADGYEGFEDLVERTNTWLKDQADIMVINMQSIMVLKDENAGSHSETGNACHCVVPGLNSSNPIDFFRIMRVAYRQLPQDTAATNDVEIPIIYPFTYETFTPELVRVGPGGKQAASSTGGSQKERLETMNETFSKVIAFLQNSGADVICAEMVSNPMQLYAMDSSHALSGPDEIQFLLTIRLFLTGQIGRVDGIASIKRASIVSSRGGGATRNSPGGAGGGNVEQRPGPIFLRSVVTRQFKYRWLVMAISAFFCMTVIVTLSVVYSNR